jgi:hypothetical protein
MGVDSELMFRVPRPVLVLLVIVSGQLALRSQTPRSGFDYFGEWSDVAVSKSEDPHAYGNSVNLWKNGGELAGFLNEYVGPVADPPIGPLQDVRFDATSGRLSFAAKLSLGVTMLAGQKEFVPTRDLYVFTGTLNDQDLSGSLEKQDHLRNGSVVTRTVVWRRTRRNDSSSKTLTEWQTVYAATLKARGPKW